jgi:transposase
MIRQKTDKNDAFVIAQFCLQNNPPAWIAKSRECKELSEVNKHIDTLKEELCRWQNRLEKTYQSKLIYTDITEKVQELEEKIQRFENEALQIIHRSEDLSSKYERLVSIKGIGGKTAIAILADMPDVKNFVNAKQYAAFVGITPEHRQSGTSVKGRSHISKKGSRVVRKSLYMAALVAKNNNEFFANWVKKLKKRGKAPKVIIVAVMRKLLHVIFGALKAESGSFDLAKAFSENFNCGATKNVDK